MTMQTRCKISVVILLVATLAANAAELPQQDSKTHLGVASCASGVCHGSVTPRATTAVLQNEYVTWSRRDRHRIAYDTLLTERSVKIAHNLGLPNAHEATICLDCHADNIPKQFRGEKFLLSDGVGCEACHGGAGNYISSHADKDTVREDTVHAGLYPADDPVQRAKLCLSCHLGTNIKMASHKIMGAGHPRLAFELDTFGILQPAHYTIDDDYKASKRFADSMTVWMIGQTVSAQQTLSLISSKLKTPGLFPELSLFDCHACHHPMSSPRWQASGAGDLAPGTVRLNDANFIMLSIIASVVSPDLDRALRQDLNNLHTVVNGDQPLESAITRLSGLINQVEQKAATSMTDGFAQALLLAIVHAGRNGQFRDYMVAEQAVMAVDMLLSTTGQRDRYDEWLDSVYQTVNAEDYFEPDALTGIMQQFDR